MKNETKGYTMGATLTIPGNHEYNHQHGLVGETRYECQCVAFDIPNCRECGGKGEVVFEDHPFEYHWSYSSIKRTFNLLGFNVTSSDYDGTYKVIDVELNIMRWMTSYSTLEPDDVERLMLVWELAREGRRRGETEMYWA
jgi:hypothetical protein